MMIGIASRAMVMAAAAAMASAVNIGDVVPRANRGPSPRAKRAYRATGPARVPNGLTFKSLQRAVNSGWEPPQPTEQAKLRHAWYRRQLAWKALRKKLGQELPSELTDTAM